MGPWAQGKKEKSWKSFFKHDRYLLPIKLSVTGTLTYLFSWRTVWNINVKNIRSCLVDWLYHAILTSFQVDLGMAVQRACQSQAEPLKFLYPLESSIKEKIESIAKFYGASGVEYSEQVIP
jgi:hypothetical protein